MTPWTTSLDARLTALWSAGISTLEIARQLGVTKNAVVGRAHRMHLPPHPSPIKRNGVPQPPRKPVERAAALRAVMTQVEPAPAPATALRRSEPCCWLVGSAGRGRPIYCDAPGVPGRPYCEAHCAVAYVSRKEAA